MVKIRLIPEDYRFREDLSVNEYETVYHPFFRYFSRDNDRPNLVSREMLDNSGISNELYNSKLVPFMESLSKDYFVSEGVPIKRSFFKNLLGNVEYYRVDEGVDLEKILNFLTNGVSELRIPIIDSIGLNQMLRTHTPEGYTNDLGFTVGEPSGFVWKSYFFQKGNISFKSGENPVVQLGEIEKGIQRVLNYRLVTPAQRREEEAISAELDSYMASTQPDLLKALEYDLNREH